MRFWRLSVETGGRFRSGLEDFEFRFGAWGRWAWGFGGLIRRLHVVGKIGMRRSCWGSRSSRGRCGSSTLRMLRGHRGGGGFRCRGLRLRGL